MSRGPLYGIKVIEIAGLAPAPFAGMIMADFGADVIRVDRSSDGFSQDNLCRGKRSITLDLKSKEGLQVLLKIIEKSDVFIEPFRPGVAEKLGFGPDVVMKLNPKIIYARMTGFGQTGPYAKMAGHDINYIAISGALSLIGRKNENPIFPVNILGDFAGGGMLCALGIMLSLFERERSGKGQVVDAAMIDGAAYLSTFILKLHAKGAWGERGTNMLDTAAHFYEVYKTKDNKYMSVGAIEPQFYKLLIKGLGLEGTDLPDQQDSEHWPSMKEKFSGIFLTRTQDEWTKIFDGTDACVTPVLDLDNIMNHPHNKARGLLYAPKDSEEKFCDPKPAPRLSRTPGKPINLTSDVMPGEHSVEILKEFEFSTEDIRKLLAGGVVTTIITKAKL